MISRLTLGTNALTGERVSLPFRDLCRHWHVPGKTGMGKTKGLELFCRHIVDSQHPLVVLDGKGDLFRAMRDYSTAAQEQERVVLVDPLDPDWAAGINYLELIGQTKPAVLAEMATEGLKKCFHEEDTFKPWLEEWGYSALLLLIHAGMTLVELDEIASIHDSAFRSAVLETLGPAGEQVARKFAELKAYGTHEAAKVTGVVRTRGWLLRADPVAEAVFGQTKTTINWRRVIDTDGIVLVNLGPHPQVTERLRTLLGTSILHQLLQAAYARENVPEPERRDAFVVADEFQEFACKDFVRALTQMRSFHLWFVLSHQELEHLDSVPGLRAAVVHECTGKLYFSLGYSDAEATVHDLFQDVIAQDKIKDEISQTKFRPKETTRVIESESHGSVSGTSRSTTTGSSSTQSASEQFSQSGPYFVVPGTHELIELAGHAAGIPTFGLPPPVWQGIPTDWQKTRTRGSSESSSQAESHSTSDAESFSTSRAVVPWYEYLEFQELSSRTWYSKDELIQQAIAWLMSDEERRAQLKVGSRKALPLVTATVDPVAVLPEEVAELRAAVMPRCARPFAEVEAEVRTRVGQFLKAAEERRAIADQAAQAATLGVPEDRREPVKPYRGRRRKPPPP